VMMVSESWFLELPEASQRSDYPQSLAGHPHSKECIFISLEHRETPTTTWLATITRDANGRPTVGEFICRESMSSEGRFASFMNGFESDPLVS
jgi:hypothetical protein